MTASDRFPFARAERLATYAAKTFGLEGGALLTHLCDWRDRDDVPLSDAALAVIVAHRTTAPDGAPPRVPATGAWPPVVLRRAA